MLSTWVNNWAGGGAVVPTIDQLLANLDQTTKSGWWEPTGGSTMYSDAGTTEVTAGSGDPVYRIESMTAHAFNFDRSTTDSRRAVATDGLTFDGSDDFYIGSLPGGAGSANMAVLALLKTSDTKACIIRCNGISPSFLQSFEDTSAGTISYNTHVDGALFTAGVATGDQMHTAIADNTNTLVETRTINLSSGTSFELGSFNGGVSLWALAGNVLAWGVLDLTALEAIEAGLGATTLALAQTRLGEIAGN